MMFNRSKNEDKRTKNDIHRRLLVSSYLLDYDRIA